MTTPTDEPSAATPSPSPATSGVSRVSWRVFAPAAAVIVLLAGLAILFPDRAESVVEAVQADVIGAFGWYYVLIVAGFVLFAL
ncbi:BCCT family transporter, partial [Streptomyces sp. SID12501]